MRAFFGIWRVTFIICIFSPLISSISHAESYDDTVACMSTLAALLNLNNSQIDGEFDKLKNVAEYNWLYTNRNVPDNQIGNAIRKFPKGTTSDQMLSSGKLTRTESIAVASMAYDARNPAMKASLKNGQAACLRLNKPQIAAFISFGSGVAGHQFNTMANDVNQSIKATQQAADDYRKNLESHPYFQYCPSYKEARYSCANAGDYDSCMKIRFGTSYKNIHDSMVCN